MASARYQEGEQPAESAVDLLAQARALTGDLESLIRRINRTNAASELEPGVTITDAIARRDALEADDLARQYRELDVRIQETNWSTELAEE